MVWPKVVPFSGASTEYCSSTYIKEEKVQEPQKPQIFFNYSVRRERERERERERKKKKAETKSWTHAGHG